MGWIWNKLLKPLLKGVAHVLAASVKWAVSRPIASIGIGLGLLTFAAFTDRPWLQAALAFYGSLLLSSGVTGAVLAEGPRILREGWNMWSSIPIPFNPATLIR